MVGVCSFFKRGLWRAFFGPDVNHALGKSMGFEEKDSDLKPCHFLATLGVGDQS